MSLEASRIIFNLPTPPKKAYFSFRYGKSCGKLAAIVLEGIRLVWAWVRPNIISTRLFGSAQVISGWSGWLGGVKNDSFCFVRLETTRNWSLRRRLLSECPLK